MERRRCPDRCLLGEPLKPPRDYPDRSVHRTGRALRCTGRRVRPVPAQIHRTGSYPAGMIGPSRHRKSIRKETRTRVVLTELFSSVARRCHAKNSESSTSGLRCTDRSAGCTCSARYRVTTKCWAYRRLLAFKWLTPPRFRSVTIHPGPPDRRRSRR
jgi:hypothetical protein